MCYEINLLTYRFSFVYFNFCFIDIFVRSYSYNYVAKTYTVYFSLFTIHLRLYVTIKFYSLL